MTIALSVQGLWDNWQRSQRDNNIHEPAVQHYVNMLILNQPLPAIAIEKLVDEGGMIRIRTADGRHRLTAAHRQNQATIDVLDTEIARSAREIFNL
ncbi:hypothetical protein EA796_08040 [Pseudomonas sp. AOB-7]|jgi:hypothetical protein|uniref:hypothetical protein n=1 Tax=unclassified Pseudomonas TaxID=196821 RepID=UPI0003968F28|nr:MULTISPECIES: hypothetical protein [unclassified Pseudomonas]ERI49969.1 hypothetical protein N878_10115 [Pseudomonas sp. EGD-AK9]RMH85451.1 hypothetical protein EA796_08040 [Pseudomonas sp. AOB-7]